MTAQAPGQAEVMHLMTVELDDDVDNTIPDTEGGGW